LLVFALLLALGNGSVLPVGLLLLVLLYGFGGIPQWPGLLRMVQRVRWLLLSILVLYGWWTPGVPLWEGLGGYGPSLEGLRQGGVRVGVLLAIVAAVHWVMSATERGALLGAVVAFTAPLRWLGVNHQRLAVRILLTLEAVPRVQAAAARIPGVAQGSRLARLAARAQGLYGAVLAQAEAAELSPREVRDGGRVPAWQWTVPLLLALLLWFGTHLLPG
jgi:energy-coupling factor transport system permease protein